MDNISLQTLVSSIDASITLREKADRAAVYIPTAEFARVMSLLKTREDLKFDMLSTHTAIDWPAKESIELIYQLYSTQHGHSLQVSVLLDRNHPAIESVSHLWAVAEWQEREVYDLFGVRYSGHPDLRRILLEDEWVGHPLRKDYQDDFMLERPW